jgi:hypothetical protein
MSVPGIGVNDMQRLHRGTLPELVGQIDVDRLWEEISKECHSIWWHEVVSDWRDGRIEMWEPESVLRKNSSKKESNKMVAQLTRTVIACLGLLKLLHQLW